MPRKNPCMFERYEQKLLVFAFYGRFHELLPGVLGARAIYINFMTRYMFESYDQKLVVCVFYGHFYELLPIVFGFQADLYAS